MDGQTPQQGHHRPAGRPTSRRSRTPWPRCWPASSAASTSSPVRSRTTPARRSWPPAPSSSSPTSTSSRPARRATSARRACTGGRTGSPCRSQPLRLVRLARPAGDRPRASTRHPVRDRMTDGRRRSPARARGARHRQDLPRRRRQRRGRLRPAPRRDPRPARRERGRQEHPDEHPGRALPAGRRRDPARRPAGQLRVAARCDRAPGSGWSTSTSRWSRRRPSPRTSCSACRSPRFWLRPGRSEAAIGRAGGAVRPAGRPARQDLAAVGRRAAAGRDPQAPLPRGPDPDHGRADRGPRPAGDRRAVPDAAIDDRGRTQHRVHQPQARRGHGHRRPDHRHAPRQWSPRPASPTGRDVTGRPRPADGRARDVLEIARAAAIARRARSSSRCATCRPRTTAGCPPCASVSLDVRAGEIVGIAAVAGNGQSELAEVITGAPAVPRQRRRSTASRGRQPTGRPGHPPRRRPRPRGSDRRRQRPEPVGRRQPDHEALPRRPDRPRLVHRRRGRAWPRARAQGRRTAIAAPSIDTEARLLSGGNLQRLILAREIDTEPAAAWSPSSRPAASTSARSRRSTGVLLERARGGHRDPAHLRGPRRDPGPRRSGRRHVRGPDRRLVPGRRGGHRDDRSADDRRRRTTMRDTMSTRPATRHGELADDAPPRAADRRSALVLGGPDRSARSPSRSSLSGLDHRLVGGDPVRVVTSTSSWRPSGASASSATRWSRRPR